ncbi:MAG: hypothetical protein PF447_06340 [Spirochaetaceae bacterium]|nr:hypothetical protein [Spirochaetaceae bacterium]
MTMEFSLDKSIEYFLEQGDLPSKLQDQLMHCSKETKRRSLLENPSKDNLF